MKAILLTRPEEFKHVDVEEPAPPGPGEALVEVHRVGICGSDVSGFLGKHPFYKYPVIPGHELGVRVLEVGPEVVNVKPTDRCSIEPGMNCQECFPCRRGASNCCETLELIGIHKDGGMCERLVVPARKLHPSEKLTMEQLALVETLSIGCHGVRRAAPEPGEKVLVIGAGPIGLSVVEFLKAADTEITVMEMNPARLDFCRNQMGVDHTILFRGDDSDVERLRDIQQGELPTTVIDATGNYVSMSNAFQYAAYTGQVIYLGNTTQEVSFKHVMMHRPELTLKASRNALPVDFQRVMGLIEDGTIDTRPWLSHHADYDEFVTEFSTWLKPESGVIKAVLHMN